MLKLTPETVKQIVEEYTNGAVIPMLAYKYGVSKTTISKALVGAGITPERKDNLFKPKHIPRKTQLNIATDAKAGLGIYELEAKYGVNHVKVADILEQFEVREKRKQQRSNPETRVLELVSGKRVLLGEEDQGKLCTEYLDQDITKTQLATNWNVSVETVERILDRNNIPTKKQVSEDEINEMVGEYKKGLVTPTDLAQMYELTPGSVKYHLNKKGIDMEHAKVVSMGVPAGYVRKRCRENTDKIIDRLLDIVESPGSEDKDVIAASKELLNRGWGRIKDEPDEDAAPSSSTPAAPLQQGAKIMKMMPPEQLRQILGKDEAK